MSTARRVQPKDHDDLDLPSSQSTNGDDAVLLATIAEQMKNVSEKKKKEKETRLLQITKNQLKQNLTAPLEDFKNATDAIDTLYTKFVFDYASAEDEIRKLWLRVRNEQQSLLILAKKRHVANIEAGKEIEAGHIQGLAQAKQGCEDFSRVALSVSSNL